MAIKSQRCSLKHLSAKELLRKHSAIIDELKSKKIVRTKNNPVGGYTEWLVSNKLKLKLEPNSKKGYDATDGKGIKYEIKGRRVTSDNPSKQLSVIRNLKKKHFKYLIGVIFDENYNIMYAAKIPYDVVETVSSYSKSQRGYVMHLRPSIFGDKRIKDITEKLTS